MLKYPPYTSLWSGQYEETRGTAWDVVRSKNNIKSEYVVCSYDSSMYKELEGVACFGNINGTSKDFLCAVNRRGGASDSILENNWTV
jgi:hypothetical protein